MFKCTVSCSNPYSAPADWPRFVDPYRDAFAAELRAAGRSPLARRVLDLAELQRLMATWPARWTGRDMQDYPLKLLRALGAARFIRHREALATS